MPIPKNAGLSHLADVARRDGLQILHSYPIKKKWQPRRLNPNLAGIKWLESDANGFDDDTEIQYIEQVSNEDPELLIQYSYGREKMSYSRPMFQIIRRDAFSGSRLSVTPCPCDRFEKSWDATRCETHTEVEWDWQRGVWKRPGNEDVPTAYASVEPPSDIMAALYDRIAAVAYGRCDCGLCRASRGEAITVQRRTEVDGRRFLTGTDLLSIDRVPEPLLAAERERVSRVIEGLPSASFDFTGIFELEVSGETVQGAQSFTIEVEPNDT